MENTSYTLGKKGEDMASSYLKSLGFIIAKRNYHSPIGEIDIIAEKDNLIVFCEVKLRTNTSMGLPREHLSISQQERIKKTALYFIGAMSDDSMEAAVYYENCEYRFDVIEIIGEKRELNHIENAFY